MTSAQFLSQKPLTGLPEPIAKAGVVFERDFAQVMRALASEVSGKPASPVPDISEAAAHLRQQMVNYYQERAEPVPAPTSDLIGLADSLATILAPLYEDIHATFAARKSGADTRLPLEGHMESA
jgi:multidrug resistance protein MdtO